MVPFISGQNKFKSLSKRPSCHEAHERSRRLDDFVASLRREISRLSTACHFGFVIFFAQANLHK